MEQDQQQQRRAAKNEFLQSLNQLEDMFHTGTTEDEETPLESNCTIDDEVVESSSIDMAAFEEAVADIEQYLEQEKRHGE